MAFEFFPAPLEDHTDAAFRTLCYRYGADATFTEMARLSALCRNNKPAFARIEIREQVPTHIQILGGNEEELAKFLSLFTPQPGFKGFNINLGCPAPDVVRDGLGCAMMKRISKIQRLLETIKSAGHGCSIKMRLGMNQFEKEKKAYLTLINSVDADFFVVHARHGGQTYAKKADFSIYEECVRTGKRIIANGDITLPEQITFLKSVGVQGAMIGRAATSDPAIFNRLKGLPAPDITALREEYLKLAEQYGTAPKYIRNILKRMDSLIPSEDTRLLM